jgi:hypothetical protein
MPDKRWKAVERGVAAELNCVLSDIGNHFSPIDRIPLLGRDGPDLTMNETGLVINIKSRKVIPDRLFPKQCDLLRIGDLVCFRMDAIRFAYLFEETRTMKPWGQLQDWYDTMDLWTEGIKNGMSTTTIMRHSQMPVERWTPEFKSNCISAIVLHRPRMPYGNCGIAIHYENLRRLSCNLKTNLSH